MDVPPQHRLRHRLCRFIQPLASGTTRRGRVERALVRGGDRVAAWRSSRRPSTRYWNDISFESYDPDRDRDRLDDALAEAAGRATHDRVTISLSGLEVRPFPYQQEMLEAIEVERDGPRPPPKSRRCRHRHRQDRRWRRWTTGGLCEADSRTPTHAALRGAPQGDPGAVPPHVPGSARRTPGFGELYVGGARPERWQHVFASVQSLHVLRNANIDPTDAFDVVVIDEFHHAEARDLSRDSRPPGTARTTRSHGDPRARRRRGRARSFFDGRTAVELRLWDALGADLLCPFHYFAVADGTDLRRHCVEPRTLRRRGAVERLHREHAGAQQS